MFINESFLSFVWQYTYFDLSDLAVAGGQKIEILSPGSLNVHSGPDFIDAGIRIDGIRWTGSVEIHVRSSQWCVHRHHEDENYNRVILHVVWEHDREAFRADGSEIPVLELWSRIQPGLLQRFRNLVYVPADQIACAPQLQKIQDIKITGMVQKTLIMRLERKSETIEHLLKEYENDWEEVSYRWLARNFGFKVNQENMFLLAKFLPYKLILRHRDNLLRLEALFFGMAGFLEEIKDEYQKRLLQEYEFLKRKYQLEGSFLKRYQWKFLRLHPQNFPTIRISQLAMFFSRVNNFFSYLLNAGDLDIIRKDLRVRQSYYWQNNYDFNSPSKKELWGLGKTSVDNILINSFVPLLVAYSRYSGLPEYQEKALFFLETIASENNKIIRNWRKAGLKCKNAADSQGLIELYTRFCSKKQCLKCNIGAEIMVLDG